MKPLRTSRHAAFAAAALFIWAQTAGVAQSLGGLKAVVTATDVYLPAKAQLVAPANVGEVFLHPQGRYALIKQEEAELPPGKLIGQTTTGAASLLLYDAKLRKTRPVWERKADGGRHKVLQIEWIAQTNCAVVVTLDQLPPSNALARDAPNASVCSLLFFNFDKSLAPRVLSTSADSFQVSVSPTRPLFVVTIGEQVRMGSAPNGALGTSLSVPPNTYLGYGWTKDGTSVYGSQRVLPPAGAATGEGAVRKWFAWDGKAAQVDFVKDKPADGAFAKEAPPPGLPFTLRTATVPVPAARQIAVRPAIGTETAPQTPPKPALPAAVLHPLFLQPNTPAPQSSALVAPDADKSYLLADQSAVLYEADGALYAVALIRITAAQYAEVQKAAAIQNAKQVGLGILMYTQDYDEMFPPETDFAQNLGPYLKNDSVFQGFSYTRPGVNMAAISEAAQTVMGYVAAPGGRAVLFTDGHVVWEPQKPPKP